MQYSNAYDPIVVSFEFNFICLIEHDEKVLGSRVVNVGGML